MNKRRVSGIVGAVLVVGIVGVGLWMRGALAPTESSAPFYVRYEKPHPVGEILQSLEPRGVVRNSTALGLYSLVTRGRQTIPAGTYQLRGGLSPSAILRALRTPIELRVRIPETNWAKRNANLLARKDVAKAEEYMSLVHDPQAFRGEVAFPLPEGTLEGYLYPDTYFLPPLLGAKAVIRRQLDAFDRKVWQPLGRPADIERILTEASLVELEAGTDADRPMIAGVIENRLRKGMYLQIDAGILYGLQKWRRLTFRDYRENDSPYNLYRHKGLPPTPICSPSLSSIMAVLHPAKHDYLYYVALPNGHSLFASDYAGHRRNIKLRIAALKAREEAKGATGDGQPATGGTKPAISDSGGSR